MVLYLHYGEREDGRWVAGSIQGGRGVQTILRYFVRKYLGVLKYFVVGYVALITLVTLITYTAGLVMGCSKWPIYGEGRCYLWARSGPGHVSKVYLYLFFRKTYNSGDLGTSRESTSNYYEGGWRFSLSSTASEVLILI